MEIPDARKLARDDGGVGLAFMVYDGGVGLAFMGMTEVWISRSWDENREHVFMISYGV